MKTVRKLLETYREDTLAIRRELHRHPELSMEEIKTTAFIKEKLTEYGIPLYEGNLSTGAAAVIEGAESGKTILFRADIDALPMDEKSGLLFASENPGVCHSCGHDIHTAALLLTARILNEFRDRLFGRVILLFQPAEEKLGGSQLVIDSGLFDVYKPELAVGLHCWPDLPGGSVGVRKGPFMASSDSVKITVRGRGGHGAHPHKSIDPITTAAYILTELQTIISRTVAPLDSAVLTMGKFTAGTAANVIPDEVVMEGTVRTVTHETRALMEEKIRTVAEHGAMALGAACEVHYERGVPAVVCDRQVTEYIERAAAAELGGSKVLTLETPSMGSEDFARYLELVPGAMFRIGTSNENPATRLPLHNSGIIFDEEAIFAGAAVFSRFALEYLK